MRDCSVVAAFSFSVSGRLDVAVVPYLAARMCFGPPDSKFPTPGIRRHALSRRGSPPCALPGHRRFVFAQALVGVALIVSLGCGGSKRSDSLVNESGDLASSGGAESKLGGWLEGTTDASAEALAGTQWTWVGAHCTDGPLDLAASGYQSTSRIESSDAGILFVTDHVFAGDECASTVVQRAVRGGDAADAGWKITEQARVDFPSGKTCGTSEDGERAGDLRRRGELLEVFIQRSAWCNGLELRMVHAPATPSARTPAELVRHHVAHFNRRDARLVAALFAQTGSLVDPFTLNSTGGATRFEGRDAVRGWYEETFSAVPWMAMRLKAIDPGKGEGELSASWDYMDPRVEEPFQGKHLYNIAGGEIFEVEVHVPRPPEAGDDDSKQEGEAAEPATKKPKPGESAATQPASTQSTPTRPAPTQPAPTQPKVKGA